MLLQAVLFTLCLVLVVFFFSYCVLGDLIFSPKEWQQRLLDHFWAWLFCRRRQRMFLILAFSMFAKLAKSDGRISAEEIDRIELLINQQFDLNSKQREAVIRVFREEKDSVNDFEHFAKQFFDAFKRTPEMLTEMIVVLLQLAEADGHISEVEETLIHRAALMFGLRESYYQCLLSRFNCSDAKVREDPWVDDPEFFDSNSSRGYKIEGGGSGSDMGIEHRWYTELGCRRTDSDLVIKRAYRRMALLHHPDRIQARGLPPEFSKIAHQKFQQIQEAYSQIKDLRGIT